MTWLLDRIGGSLSRAGDDALILGAYRTEAAGTASARSSGTGLSGYRSAHETISRGNHAVYGGVDQIVAETVRAPRNNAIQNAGSVGDKFPDDAEGPRPIELPL